MTLFLTIIIFAVIITILVGIHEFGHFLAAKLSGVGVDEFAIGFGPTLISKKYKGTNYKFNLFPLGGYVQLAGESDNANPNGFRNKRLRVKAIVLMAGIIMNLLLAVILLGIYLTTNNYRFAVPKIVDYQFTNAQLQSSYYPLIVSYVDPEGPSVGNFQENEALVTIAGSKFSSMSQFLDLLKQNQNREVEFGFLDINTFEVTSRDIRVGTAGEDGSILKVGFVPYDSQSGRETYFIRYSASIGSSVSMTYDAFVYQFKALAALIFNAVTTGDYQEISDSVGGLPAVGNQVGQLVEFQAYDVLIPLTALFSVNLAMFNVLPFPALDGGQLLFAVIEKLRRKKFSDEFLNKVNFTGFVLLMGLGLLVTLKDIVQLNWLGNIVNFVSGILGR